MLNPSYYTIGFTTAAARMEFLAPPTPPSNYGAEAAARWLVGAKQRQLDEAKYLPVIATVTAAVVYNWNGQPVFHERNAKPGAVAERFFRWLPETDYEQTGAGLRLQSEPCLTATTWLIGFRIHTFLAIAAHEALGEGVPVPIRLWRDGIGVCDPYEYLVASDVRRHVSLETYLHFFLGEQPADAEALETDPRRQAMLAQALVDYGQLFGCGGLSGTRAKHKATASPRSEGPGSPAAPE